MGRRVMRMCISVCKSEKRHVVCCVSCAGVLVLVLVVGVGV